MTDLSICIPTYNRVFYLDNCLNSIKLANKSNLKIEVCVSDNFSDENTEKVITKYKKYLNLNFNKNKKNLGGPANILKSVSMAKGEFCWLLGNDDIVLKNTFEKLNNLFKSKKNIDFFYLNSYQLNLNDIEKLEHPLKPHEINFENKKKFSNYPHSKEMNFFELIDPKKSYEFLLSMFLCAFKRRFWLENLEVIDEKKLFEPNPFSNLQNTATQSIIWARGFKNKQAYFLSEPVSANIHGPRSHDWGNYYPFIEGIRIPQLLDNYRKEGLPLFQYLRCKNFALRRLIPTVVYMLKNRSNSNLKYVSFKKDLFYNLIYPMVYISIIIITLKKIFYLIKKTFKLKN
jgi:glycosyltransferase involved in cell wall biosynthesis